MSPLIHPFSLSTSLRSQLISNPPTTIPTIDDLVSLEEELKLLQTRAEQRLKKAETEIKTLEVAVRKLKEKERDIKGKAREKESKVKRERTRTPDVDDYSFPSPTTSASHLNLPSKFKVDLKKKKRKRDVDSDGEGKEIHKLAKPSPTLTAVEFKKPQKVPVNPQPKMTPTGYRIAEDFNEPSTSTLPPRPVPQAIPAPGPLKPSDVQDDFSKCKPPTQTAITTFYSSIEPWLRPLREDDLGLLQWDGDALEPFLIPPLGRHYNEAWDDEDKALYGYSLVPQVQSPTTGPSIPARLSHNASWDPSALTDSELVTDERGVGPIAERVVSALLPIPADKILDSPKQEEGHPKDVRLPLLNTMDLEDRLKGELQSIGLWGDEEPNYAASEDHILTELRRCQRELRSQMLLNKARRARILSIAQDRLAYQEYVETRDVLDRQISSIYSRLQKRDSAKSASIKKRKKPGSAAMMEEKEKEKERFSPASLGLGPDPDGRLVVNEQLRHVVQLRRQWVDVVGGAMMKRQEEEPGRLWGLPSRSIFEGIEEDMKELEAAAIEREGDG